MIAITKALFELVNRNDLLGKIKANQVAAGQTTLVPQNATNFAQVPAKVVPAAAVQAPPPATVQAAPPANVEVAKKVVQSAATPKAMSPEYKKDLTTTFNSLPNKGKDLKIAGKDQPYPATRADQQTFDNKYKEVVKRKGGGVPEAAPKPVAPPPAAVQAAPVAAVKPPEVTANGTPIPPVVGSGPKAIEAEYAAKAVQPVQQDISGQEAAGIALKKGAHAAGEAVGSFSKKAAEFAGENPLAAGVALGGAWNEKIIK